MKSVRNPVSSRPPMALHEGGAHRHRQGQHPGPQPVAPGPDRRRRPALDAGDDLVVPVRRRTRVLDVDLADRGVDPRRAAGRRARCRRRRSTNARRSDHSGPMRGDRAGEPATDGHAGHPGEGDARVGVDEGEARWAAAAGSPPTGSRRRPWRRRGSPRAAGKSHAESVATAPASTQQRKARRARVVPMAQRRPCRKRSSSGPMKGASSANGAIVSTRNSATWAAGLVGGDREDRAGEADGQGGVAADVDEVQLDEPRQPALAGTRGAGEGAGPLGPRPAAAPGDAGRRRRCRDRAPGRPCAAPARTP